MRVINIKKRIEMDENFIYGIAKVEVNNLTIGYIEKGSFQWGGTPPETVDVEAEQVPSAPVLVLMQKNGTISPQFNLIQLNLENLQAVMGGTVEGKKWSAPSTLAKVSGPAKITTVSGAVIEIPNAQVSSNLTGNLTLTETSKIQVTLKAVAPDGGGSPYSIDFAEAEQSQQGPVSEG